MPLRFSSDWSVPLLTQSNNEGELTGRLLTCKVSANTLFDRYLKGFRNLSLVTVDGGGELALAQEMVRSRFRSSIGR